MYFLENYFNSYLFISLTIFAIILSTLLISNYYIRRNPIDVMNEINEDIESIKETDEKRAENLTTLIEIFISSKVAYILFLLLLSFIPLVRFVFVFGCIQTIFERGEQ